MSMQVEQALEHPNTEQNEVQTFFSDFHLFMWRQENRVFDDWKFWLLIIIGPYLLLLIEAAIIDSYTLNTYRRVVNFLQGDIGDFIFLTPMITFIVGVLAYNIWRRQVPEIFQWLFNEKKLLRKNTKQNISAEEYVKFLKDYRNTGLRSLRLHIGLIVLFCGIAFLFFFGMGVYVYMSQMLSSDATLLFLRRAHLFTRWFLAPFIWLFFVGIAIQPLYITGQYLNKLVDEFDLKVQPTHIDKSGGLSPIGDFCVTMTMPVLLGTTVLSVMLLFLSFFGITNPGINMFVFLAFILIILPIIAFIFFRPMWGIHRDMFKQKQRYGEEISSSIYNLRAKLLEKANNPDSLDKDEVARLTELLKALEERSSGDLKYPVWPFDWEILGKLITPQIISALSGLGSIIVSLSVKGSFTFNDFMNALKDMIANGAS